jgi:hypothetical protein
MCDRPPGGIEQLIAASAQRNQVLEVFGAWSLVNRCVKLQEYLVSTAGKLHNQTAVTSLNRPFRKAVWQAEIQERSRTDIGPILPNSHDSSCRPRGIGQLRA